MGEPKPLTAYQQTYHWRNKNCAPWAYEWVKNELPGVEVSDGNQEAKIVEVTSVSGDCDLGQRKGKILTIYDLEVELKWEGKSKDGSEVKGSLKIPEMSHETIDGLSDYVYDISITTSSSSTSELLSYLKSTFPEVLTKKLNEFRPALLAAHGTSDASAATSGTSTPATAGGASGSYSPAPPAKESSAPKVEEKKEEKKSSVGNTTTVEIKADLQVSADDLWDLLTDEKKIPMWSRSNAKLSLTPEAPYELFGGNVRGKVVQVDKPNKLVQTWQVRNPQWPSEHYATLSIVLAQGSDSTSATFTLDGVPSGQASEVEKALDTFYIRGLKQMGLGTIL